jgi:hypothetical protein
MRNAAGKISWIAVLCWCWQAQAQLLPQVQVPGVQLPGVQVPSLPVDPALRGVGEALRNLPTRAVRADRLFEQHHAELDHDPHGELVVRAEVVAIDMTETALAKALKADFRVLRTQELTDLAVRITVLQTPAGMSASRGLKKLRALDPDGAYDFNHVYLDRRRPDRWRLTRRLGGAKTLPAAGDSAGTRVGLIDGGIDAHHISLRENTIHDFGCGGTAVPSAHGTAVASLLAGSATHFRGAAPHAELFAADVYCGSATGGAVDAVAAAFGWMARERVAVINVSLVGPRNALLERVVVSPLPAAI